MDVPRYAMPVGTQLYTPCTDTKYEVLPQSTVAIAARRAYPALIAAAILGDRSVVYGPWSVSCEL